MASTEFHGSRQQTSSIVGGWMFWLPLLINRLKLWQAVARERRQLRFLDNDVLTDIGLSRTDAKREGNRPFWDTDGLDLR